jgi:ornithine decarboxylase
MECANDCNHNNTLVKSNIKLYGSQSTIHDIIYDQIEDIGPKEVDEAFFIVDLGELTASYFKWTELLPNVKPYYAMKCNPDQILLEALSQLGCNFDCASEDEIKKVLAITADPSRIIFANPCKTVSHLRFAQQNNVNTMTFDCEEELRKIKLNHPHSELILRLAVDDSQSVCRFNAKFGCTMEKVGDMLKLAKILQLKIIGFSFHVGSGCSSAEVFYEALRSCRNATNIANHMGVPISVIDLGGGFPGKQKVVGFEEIAQRINEGLRDFFHKELANQTIEVIAEPGRYFAEKTQTLVLNVIGKKEIQHAKGSTTSFVYYLNDGIYGSFNCIYFDHSLPKLIPFNKNWDDTLYRSTVFGPTCDSMDIIAEAVLLPELFIGEWVYVKDFGAYTSASSSAFNGFKTRKFKYIFREKI